jgi:hypothetical protein
MRVLALAPSISPRIKSGDGGFVPAFLGLLVAASVASADNLTMNGVGKFAVKHIQNQYYQRGTSGNTDAVTMNVNAGDAIVVTFGWPSGSALQSFSDSNGDACTALDNVTYGTFVFYDGYCLNAKGGSTTVTATFASSQSAGFMTADEFSGVSSLDVHNTYQTASTGTISSPAWTMTSPDDLLVGTANLYGCNGSVAAGAGFTEGYVTTCNPSAYAIAASMTAPIQWSVSGAVAQLNMMSMAFALRR